MAEPPNGKQAQPATDAATAQFPQNTKRTNCWRKGNPHWESRRGLPCWQYNLLSFYISTSGCVPAIPAHSGGGSHVQSFGQPYVRHACALFDQRSQSAFNIPSSIAPPPQTAGNGNFVNLARPWGGMCQYWGVGTGGLFHAAGFASAPSTLGGRRGICLSNYLELAVVSEASRLNRSDLSF